MNQVFLNLLINAAQAIEKQGEVSIKTWNEDDSIFVSIADTGCGIPPEIINRIYEPFFTTKEVGKGTGIGLSISFDIVRKHNGELIVESEPGKGATFPKIGDWNCIISIEAFFDRFFDAAHRNTR